MAHIDQTIVQSLMAGEHRAYEAVVDMLYESVYRFAYRLCGDSATAADITQETFLAIWENVGSFKGQSRFKTWVFGIAYRQFLRVCEKQKAESRVLDRLRDPGSSGSQAFPWRMDKSLWIRDAVDGLPDVYRHVVLLVHVHELSYREASQVLGVPLGTVKSRMNTAYIMLRSRLEDADELASSAVR